MVIAEDFYTDIYALIKDGVVGNLVRVNAFDTATQVAIAQGYDEAVCVNQYFVSIGDEYINGEFIRNNNKIERQLELHEKVELQEQIIAEQAQQISDLETVVLQLGGII